MPLFRNKFQPKKCAPRKVAIVSSLRRILDPLAAEKEFGVLTDNVRLNLGHQEFVFENGEWQTNEPHARKKSPAETDKIQKENNMLKIQVEILMDMLTQTTLEANMRK